MHTFKTTAIVLRRINYGEADRIITLLTRDNGKLPLIAKGVRKEKSKLAGGIELFSESEVSFIKGRGEVGTLVSTRLIKHFANIHVDLVRLKVAGEMLKRFDKVSENEVGPEFYDLLLEGLKILNTQSINPLLAEAWVMMRLMLLLGEVINVEYDSRDQKFDDAKTYRFLHEDNRFCVDENGDVEPKLIKFLRLLGSEDITKVIRIKNLDELAEHSSKLLNLSYAYHRPTVTKSF